MSSEPEMKKNLSTEHSRAGTDAGKDVENVRQRLGLNEDWTAALLGLLILGLAMVISLGTKPSQLTWATSASVAAGQTQPAEKPVWNPPLSGWIAESSKWKAWQANPLESLTDKNKQSILPGLLGALLISGLIGIAACLVQKSSCRKYLSAFPAVFVLAAIAFWLAKQEVLESANLEYALWALVVGLAISNSILTPKWMLPAVRSELYIKVGLVLLGAEVLFTRLLALGVAGVVVSWIVTPVVLIATYIFGQRVLKMQSRSLNLVISADMSVCGVSAAIATAAACKAKKEELSLAVGMSLAFTVLMMIVMPMAVKAIGLSPEVGGAWIGGTIDSTGAVAAAGEALGKEGRDTAVTVKMIQNILIGVVALGVAIYWTRWIEKSNSQGSAEIGIGEIWKRFPKFVLGFVAVSVLCSVVFAASLFGELWVKAVTDGVTKPLRTWLFCLAFVCIGLETNFRELMPFLRSGKPLTLYLCGQALNVVLTLIMAQWAFGWKFAPLL